MKARSVFTLAALIALGLTLPGISSAKMNRSAGQGMSAEHRTTQQGYRQMNTDRQPTFSGMQSGQAGDVSESLRTRQQLHVDETGETIQDFIRERRQDHLSLQQDQ